MVTHDVAHPLSRVSNSKSASVVISFLYPPVFVVTTARSGTNSMFNLFAKSAALDACADFHGLRAVELCRYPLEQPKTCQAGCCVEYVFSGQVERMVIRFGLCHQGLIPTCLRRLPFRVYSPYEDSPQLVLSHCYYLVTRRVRSKRADVPIDS